MNQYWQQGDVVLISTKIPKDDYEATQDPIVQHGENGHFHKLMFRHESVREAACPQWEMFKQKHGDKRYLKINEPTDLTHEEHKTHHLAPGEYEIRIVREYDHFAEEARSVID